MKFLSTFLVFVVLVFGCNSSDDSDENKYTSLVSFKKLDSGSECKFGGIKINVGLDLNSNTILEEDEIQTSEVVCDGIKDIEPKEYRILLRSDYGTLSGCSGTSINRYSIAIKFDKNNWKDLKHISYYATMKTDNKLNKAYVDLYNNTNYSIIPNSRISTNNEELTTVHSGNLIDDIPNNEFTLYMRLYSENVTDDNVWLSRKAELILRR